MALKLLGVSLSTLLILVALLGLFYGLNAIAHRLPPPWNQRVLPWLFVGPALGMVSAYLLIPMLYTLYLSVLDGRSQRAVGLQNYIDLFTDPSMSQVFRNNLLWLVLVTGVSVGLGLILAVLMDRVRYEAIAKALMFLPMAISFVGASVIWKFVYAYRPAGTEQIGLLNAIATGLGFEPVGWLVDPSINTLALIAIMIWLETGFCLVILSAAVKGIPQDIIEAARMDGASELEIFARITMPMIRSTIAVVATTVIILVLKVFDIVYVMTGGNQGTEVIASRMIKEMFNTRHYGRGSAIAVLLLVAVIPVMVANIRRRD